LTALAADGVVAGEWCLVLTDSGKYLRAEIVVATCGPEILVKLVDVGMCEEVTLDKVNSQRSKDKISKREMNSFSPLGIEF